MTHSKIEIVLKTFRKIEIERSCEALYSKVMFSKQIILPTCSLKASKSTCFCPFQREPTHLLSQKVELSTQNSCSPNMFLPTYSLKASKSTCFRPFQRELSTFSDKKGSCPLKIMFFNFVFDPTYDLEASKSTCFCLFRRGVTHLLSQKNRAFYSKFLFSRHIILPNAVSKLPKSLVFVPFSGGLGTLAKKWNFPL